jgi:hypothetical protein
MVTFQCEVCVKALKKKQAERHQYECRGASHFTCLTCWQVFDLNTIKAHISCVTEEQKYQKGDNTGKKNGIKFNQSKDLVVPVNLKELKWSGFRKTSKKILMGHENFKLPINELFEKLAEVYSYYKKVIKEEVCMNLLKKHTNIKLENDERFIMDLSKNTIRYKA